MKDAQLVLIHDDGTPEIHIVIHGFSPVRSYPDFQELCCQINEAELRGKVYVCFWKSGCWKLARNLGISIANFAPPVATIALAGFAKYLRAQNQAEKTGNWLARHLHKIPNAAKWPITLVGFSLGCRALFHMLDAVDASQYYIRRVILLSGVVHGNPSDWEDLAQKVRNEIVNVYSKEDWALWAESLPRWLACQEQSVGRNPIDSTHRKIRNVKCRFKHGEYLTKFDQALWKAHPSRVRSRDYHGKIEVECPHCDCDAMLIAEANTEVWCSECGTEFSYKPADKKCHWYFKPKRVGCSFCPDGEIYVQATNRYQCPECRRWHDFEREGERIFVLNAP